MKVAISVTGQDLSAPVDPRFGRAQGFLVGDSEQEEFKHITNPNIDAAGGAGIQTGQMIANEGVEVVITGNVGPNAHRVLDTAGIRIYRGASGTAGEALGAFKDNRLSEASSPTVGEFHGKGGGGGSGTVPGGGPGTGMGQGRGMGRGMGGGGRGRGGGRA